MKFSIVKGDIIHKILLDSYQKIFDITRLTYLNYGKGMAVNSGSHFLRFSDKANARIIALPGYIQDGEDISGIKWISSYPTNVQNNVPRASAVIILNDYETGYPFACLEGSIISAARTAASSVIGAYYLNNMNKKVSSLGLVGNGIIAKYLYAFFKNTSWDIGEINLYDKDLCSSERLQNKIAEDYSKLKINICSTVEELCKKSEIIAFTTTAPSPYISDENFFLHKPIVLNISLRDLSPDIILNSFNITDDIDHVLNADSSPHLAYKKVKNRDFLNGTIVDLIKSDLVVDKTMTKIFSPMGLGVLDLSVARYMYNEASKLGELEPIDDFFYEVLR